MAKKQSKKQKAEELWVRAEHAEGNGKMLSRFRLMLAAAKLGEPGAQTRLGDLYSNGGVVRKNLKSAYFWYERAYRKGYAVAALNLGVTLQREGQLDEAIPWLERAIQSDYLDGHLQLGKIYLAKKDLTNARKHFSLILVTKENWYDDARREASKLLTRLERQTAKPA